MPVLRTRARLMLVTALSVAAVGQAQQTRRPATKGPARPVATPQPPPSISLGVAPFRQTVGTPETEALGDGMSDSLANALKGYPSLSVAGPNAIRTASIKEHVDLAKDDDGGAQIAQILGLGMIVVGSYQHVGTQLIVDARILNSETALVHPGSSISLNAKYPEEYASLLTQLANRVTMALKVPTSALQSQRAGAAFMTSSSEALSLYDRAIRQMGEGTTEALRSAVELLTQCLKTDPGYALAYAARADAQNRLADATRASGGSAEDLTKSAVEDATQAVKARPNLARGQTALAEAQTASGNFDQAVQAANRALALSPNDSAARIARSRAKNNGELVADKDLSLLLLKQPWVQYMFFYLPKVIVKNQSKFKLTVSFSPASGDPYPPLTLQAETTKAMTLFPGNFKVDLDSDAGILKREYEFKGGEQYELTYRAEEIPLTRIVGRNDGNSPAYVTFDGPKKREVVINPGAQEVLSVQSGQYSISCAGAAGGNALQQRQDYLRPGGEYRYVCSVHRTMTFRPQRP